MIQDRPLIALLTDFGTQDTYVGSLKASLYSITSNVNVVDISHAVAKHNISQAAFMLGLILDDFPPGTIFVVVVDPGVGSERRGLLITSTKHYFIGPDNGVFSAVYKAETTNSVYQLENPKYFGKKLSSTFHGRDVFGPCAAYLASGVSPAEFGPEVKSDLVEVSNLEPEVSSQSIIGEVMHIDAFGNLVTNIHSTHLEAVPEFEKAAFEVCFIDKKLSFLEFYSEGERNVPFALFGSSGRLEIALNSGSAADAFFNPLGQKVTLLP